MIEQVIWGRKRFEDLVEFFYEGEDTDLDKKKTFEKNFRSREVKPLKEKDLLVETDEGYDVDFDVLDRIFKESGGEESLREDIEAVQEERRRHRQKLKECGPGAMGGEGPDMMRIEAAIKGELDMEDLKDPWERSFAEGLVITETYVNLHRAGVGDDEARDMAEKSGFYHRELNPDVLIPAGKDGSR